MIIYPAIDLRGGRVVRLKEGDPNQQKVFSDDPLAMAQRWIDEGAAWIHMVNLDGSFADANNNERILEQAAKLGKPIQFGGGMRTMADIERALNRGAARVVLGTIAIKNPEIVVEAVKRWGAEKLCVGLDARDGKIATHGWQQTADITPVELGKQMAAIGLRHALFTDVNRDGKLGGGNIDGTINVGRETGLKVIASGGVSTVDDIQRLVRSRYVAGAVIGMALYEGKITLKEALNAAKAKDEGENAG
jgi:phosphoribosylformimino-5-aminoimidazole carboxamide ribotide isomerase